MTARGRNAHVLGEPSAAKRVFPRRVKDAAPCYAPLVMLGIPASSRWIFWDVDPDAIELERDANGVLARVLERGCLDDVKWLIQVYGPERIHAFFRDIWAPEVSDRTRGFWRAFFEAENETWAAPPAFRSSNSSLWIA